LKIYQDVLKQMMEFKQEYKSTALDMWEKLIEEKEKMLELEKMKIPI